MTTDPISLAGHSPAIRIGGARRSSTSNHSHAAGSPPKAHGSAGSPPKTQSHGQPAPPAHHKAAQSQSEAEDAGEVKSSGAKDDYPRPTSTGAKVE